MRRTGAPGSHSKSSPPTTIKQRARNKARFIRRKVVSTRQWPKKFQNKCDNKGARQKRGGRRDVRGTPETSSALMVGLDKWHDAGTLRIGSPRNRKTDSLFKNCRQEQSNAAHHAKKPMYELLPPYWSLFAVIARRARNQRPNSRHRLRPLHHLLARGSDCVLLVRATTHTERPATRPNRTTSARLRAVGTYPKSGAPRSRAQTRKALTTPSRPCALLQLRATPAATSHTRPPRTHRDANGVPPGWRQRDGKGTRPTRNINATNPRPKWNPSVGRTSTPPRQSPNWSPRPPQS